MKLFFDTEFTGLHQNTTLISLGIVAENGQQFYAEFTDYDKNQVNDWLQENVIDNLFLIETGEREKEIVVKNDYLQPYTMYVLNNKAMIKRWLLVWLEQFETVEFWSDVLAYDWVLLQGLLADYTNGYPQLPKNVNYIPFDLATLMLVKGVDPDINRETFAGVDSENQKHNALWDAQIIKKCYKKVVTVV